MYRKRALWFFVACLLLGFNLGFTIPNADQMSMAKPLSDSLIQLENPVTVDYLKKKLRKGSPRLMLTKAVDREIKQKIQSDPMIKNYYAAIRLNADRILKEKLLKRNVVGRRLLGTSREMLYRMGILSMVYRMDKDPEILDRIDRELLAVCTFKDWNPSHFLDVAEMSLAVAIAVDWVGKDLPKSTVQQAKTALIEKGLKPSFTDASHNWWIDRDNNWNQVCHGGMIAAAIAIAEQDLELASKTISRALENMPHALAEYGPDGIYPEGSTYWSYGTSYSVMTSSMLQTALGTDFGLANYPSFLESADFRLQSIAPSGWYYNFADCGDKRQGNGDIILAWFANHTGNPLYLEKERFLLPPEKMHKLSRFAAPGLTWLAAFEAKNSKELPLAWKGDGANPIVFFRDANNNFFFGGKGGQGSVNHGNMDAGSFILELDGVRWVIDPGNQNYHALEKTGFDLWNRDQNSQRWTLLTKNNFGHSTLSVNHQLHAVDGFAPIVDFKGGPTPEATIDLSEVFGADSLSRGEFVRRFVKESDRSLLIEDEIHIADSVQMITWQLMTAAEVVLTRDGALLNQDGKQLKIQNLSHPEISFSIIALDPPPLKLDRRIEGLKRIELRMPAYELEGKKGQISVRLLSP